MVSKSELYYDSLSYWTLEALQGYAQHRELPTHSISFSSKRDESNANRIRHRHIVSFGSVPEAVREDGGFKTSFLRELDSISDKNRRIELMPLIRDYASGILITQLASHRANWRHGLVRRYQLSHGTQCDPFPERPLLV